MSKQPLLHNQYYNPNNIQSAYPSVTSYRGGYPPPQQQQPPGQYYPPPQGYVPPQHNIIQPPPVQYGTVPSSSYGRGPSTYASLGGERYNPSPPQQPPPPIDPYHAYYQQAQRMNETNHMIPPTTGQPVTLPPPETMPSGATPKPGEIKVNAHLRKSICFFVTSLIIILLWPVVPFTFSALMFSIGARMSHNKRNYDQANKRGSRARCCLIISLPVTVFSIIFMISFGPFIFYLVELNS